MLKLEIFAMTTYRTFSSGSFIQRGRGQHRLFNPSAHIQRGDGLGSLFRSFFTFAKPFVKKGVSSIAKAGRSKIAQSIVKDVKNAAIETGLELATTALKPESGKEDYHLAVSNGVNNLKRKLAGRVDETKAALLDPAPTKPKKRRRGRRGASKDIFDD